MSEDLTLFEDKQIRHIYNEEKEVYYLFCCRYCCNFN